MTRDEIEAPIRQHSWLLALSFGGLMVAGAMVALVLFARARAAGYRRQYEQEMARARAEAGLRQTERMLRAVLEFAPMPIYIASSPGRFLAVNPAWEAVTGIDQASALAHAATDLFPAAIAGEFERSTRRVFETGELVRREQVIDLGGSLRCFDIVKFPIFDETGKVSAVAGILLDVSERRRNEVELRKESTQTRALLHVAKQLAATLDPAGVLNTLCRETALALNVEAVNIKLLRPDGYLRHAASYGLPPEWIARDQPVTLDQYLALAGPGGDALWPDAQQPGLVPWTDLYSRFDIRSVMGGLISATNQPLGTIAVYSRGKRRDFRPGDLDVLRGVANLAATALTNARLFEQTRNQTDRLRLLAARLADIEDRERGRLARELHDQVGQNLTALGVSLSLAALDLQQGTATAAGERLATAQDLVAATGTAIRNVLLDLRPPALDDQGLMAALRGAAGRLAATTGIRAVVEGTEPSPRLDPGVTTVLYRIAQEALTNVVRHAHATTLAVTVRQADKMIRMTVADDGCGFDVAARNGAAERPSWGLMIMEERARTIGAQLRVESAPGSGTTISVEIPQ